MSNFLNDYNFWIEWENKILQYFIDIGYKVQRNGITEIHDFIITNKSDIPIHIELKTRRCTVSQYEDTLIGANKLWEARNKYYSSWEETLFLFQYEDWLYYINPLEFLPRKEYVLQRWDRWIDKKKGWIYFKTSDLKKIY